MRATHLALSGWLAEEQLGSDWTKQARVQTQTPRHTEKNTNNRTNNHNTNKH
jgi:hypothetical protein